MKITLLVATTLIVASMASLDALEIPPGYHKIDANDAGLRGMYASFYNDLNQQAAKLMASKFGIKNFALPSKPHFLEAAEGNIDWSQNYLATIMVGSVPSPSELCGYTFTFKMTMYEAIMLPPSAEVYPTVQKNCYH